jgi:hypothetical protein
MIGKPPRKSKCPAASPPFVGDLAKSPAEKKPLSYIA